MKIRQVFGWICAVFCLGSVSASALAQGDASADPFGGRLFAPNVILERQDELGLSDMQRQQIREIVLSTQATVSERQWDMREAYREVMLELDAAQINEPTVIEMVQAVLETENSVKLAQVSMLVRLRNLLTAEQLALLRETAQ
jgi:Spy/CpxP family protein refolding chaperone